MKRVFYDAYRTLEKSTGNSRVPLSALVDEAVAAYPDSRESDEEHRANVMKQFLEVMCAASPANPEELFVNTGGREGCGEMGWLEYASGVHCIHDFGPKAKA